MNPHAFIADIQRLCRRHGVLLGHWRIDQHMEQIDVTTMRDGGRQDFIAGPAITELRLELHDTRQGELPADPEIPATKSPSVPPPRQARAITV